MKNLLYIIPLLLSPIEQTNKLLDFDINLQENTGTASIYYGETERTNAADTYSTDTSNPSYAVIYDILQKYQTQSFVNRYLDVKMNDYSACTYLGGSQGLTNEQYYNYDFNIIQITPYLDTEAETAELTLTARVDFNYNRQIITSILDNIHIFQTNKDLSELINRQDWSTAQSKPEEFYNRANQIAGSNKTQLYNRQNVNMQGFDILDDEMYEIDIGNIQLNNGITTYIYGNIYWYLRYSDTLNIQYNPTEQTQLLHIDSATINFNHTLTHYNEIVDIPGLMFTILGMPFSFISQAFNITLYPNTPYQVNISNLFLSFIAIALLLWVLKLILGRADLGGWIADQQYNAKQAKHDNRSFDRAVKRRELQRKRTEKLNNKHNEKTKK